MDKDNKKEIVDDLINRIWSDDNTYSQYLLEKNDPEIRQEDRSIRLTGQKSDAVAGLSVCFPRQKKGSYLSITEERQDVPDDIWISFHNKRDFRDKLGLERSPQESKQVQIEGLADGCLAIVPSFSLGQQGNGGKVRVIEIHTGISPNELVGDGSDANKTKIVNSVMAFMKFLDSKGCLVVRGQRTSGEILNGGGTDGDTRGRNVIIFRWNPYKKEDGEPIWTDSEKALHAIQNGSSHREDWSCHTRDVRKGDTIYIYKSKGKEEAGIVAHGTVVSDRRVENKEGRVDIEIDSMVDYTSEEYITWSTIKTLTTNGDEPKTFSDDRASEFPLPDDFDEKKITDAWNLLWLKKILSNESLNLIRFGAPGTGKSYEINKFFKEPGWSSKERVTFHPDYSYANFVGAYKPYMKAANKDEEQKITYAFVPGPFTRVLVNALRDPKGKHLLVIEEINRANTAAVFGDIFQLLDRGKNGESEYAISPSQDLAKFLREALKQPKKNDDAWWWLTTEPLAEKEVEGKIRNLKIPSNMYLWATMNSADQGVFPMDTAFKRRWSFEYVDINKGADKIEGDLAQRWNALRMAINVKLIELKVNEDKCMGPFFLTEGDLKDVETFDKVFKSKVLMYLFEDAARQKRTQVFADGCDTLSEIFKAVNDKEKCVFKEGKEGDLNKTLESILAMKDDDRNKPAAVGEVQEGDAESDQQKPQDPNS